MAGLTPDSRTPTALTVHQASQQLEVHFDDGAHFQIPFELLRVYSPSAEVQGHGPGQETLQFGKRGVGIKSMQPVGHYAVQPVFTDGHESGIFTWAYLYELGRDQAALWQRYEERLRAGGHSRDQTAAAPAITPPPALPGACDHRHGAAHGHAHGHNH